ncbi:MAG: SPASM domain-containing protein [Syntrophobacter sp.]
MRISVPNRDRIKYRLVEHHLFTHFERHILFNVKTMLFYEVTPLVRDLILRLSDHPEDHIKSRLAGRFSKREIQHALDHLEKEHFLEDATPARESNCLLKKRKGLRHLELMVTHGCNMRCLYCYGDRSDGRHGEQRLLYGSGEAGMSLETALKGIDFLFRESGRRKEVSVIFFGGEPLLEMGLLERIVPYVREKEMQTGKKADISLSTNGLLLKDGNLEFLVKNRISCQVSLDGPGEIHDRNRLLPDGSGSYERVMDGVRRLIARRGGKVPVRATIAHGRIDLPAIVEHLLSLGFGSVHAEPAIGGNSATSITPGDLDEIKKQIDTLALFLVRSVRENRFFNFTNLVRQIRQTRVVRERLAHYCGAGRTYLAMARDGGFYPCHRFVGMEEYRMGDIDTGPDWTLRNRILDLTVDNRAVCRECWARYLCGGGCWKHAVDRSGCLERPDEELSCRITRHYIECAMAINSELRVSDQDILSRLYEESTEPYLITGKGD